MNLLDLGGQVAVVTGAAKGIGAATARMLERAGARVVGLDVLETGGLSIDVTNETRVRDAFSRVATELGGLDIERGRALVFTDPRQLLLGPGDRERRRLLR